MKLLPISDCRRDKPLDIQTKQTILTGNTSHGKENCILHAIFTQCFMS